jgi:5-methylcytosine-specific restriction endonuclease McrA
MVIRACVICGRRCSGARCPRHAITPRGAEHRRARRQVLSEEQICWLCGEPGRPDDPLSADHVIARAAGGADHRSNFRAAHLSCNKRRGTRPPQKQGGG